MMWTLLSIAVAAWFLLKIAPKLRDRVKDSTYSYRKHWALALAQPMVEAQSLDGFSSPDSEELAGESAALLRAGLLHYMELPPTVADDEAVRSIAERYETSWFQADLRSLQEKDDPRAAIAFACVRAAFFTRILMLMGWIDGDSGWRVLLLNAQRAQECFSGWAEFGQAYLAGRRQWTTLFRADPLGSGLDDAQVRRFTSGIGPWALLPWSASVIFDPREELPG